MAGRGPAAIPTASKVIRGTARPDRTKNEPKPPLTAVAETPPARMTDPIALELWHEHIGGLIATRVMTDADRSAFSMTCEAYASTTTPEPPPGAWHSLHLEQGATARCSTPSPRSISAKTPGDAAWPGWRSSV